MNSRAIPAGQLLSTLRTDPYGRSLAHTALVEDIGRVVMRSAEKARQTHIIGIAVSSSCSCRFVVGSSEAKITVGLLTVTMTLEVHLFWRITGCAGGAVVDS